MKKSKILLTNIDAANLFNALNALAEHISGIAPRFLMSENIDAIEIPRTSWAKHREKIVIEFSEVSEDGKPKTIETSPGVFDYVWLDADKKTAAEEKLKELDEVEIEISAYRFPISMLQKAEKANKEEEAPYWAIHKAKRLLINDLPDFPDLTESSE